MALYRYLFLLSIFSLLLLLAWLAMPEREPEPTDILNVTEEDISALKQALESEDLEKVVQQLPAKLREEAEIVIQHPSFLGKDREGLKWHVTADKAYQERNNTELGLEKVIAKRAEGTPKEEVSIAAPTGRFDDGKNTLFLGEGFVGLVKEIGVTGRKADYAMQSQEAKGEGFSAKNQKGQLSADVFSANLIAETAEFNGNVRMRIKLKPRQADKAQQTEGQKEEGQQ